MRQIGHSAASLYKNASIACPFTYGSLGRWISCGTMSPEGGVFEVVVSDARVFDRGRKGEGDCKIREDEAIGEAGGGRDEAGWKGERLAEVSEECGGVEMGTIKFCTTGVGSGDRDRSSSRGTSSAAGISSPLAAATS
jgi:hypothetical protein